MLIYVRVRDFGRYVYLDVDSSDTVYDLKEKIYDKEGIPPNCLMIFCKGKPPLDCQTVTELEFNCIQKEERLQLYNIYNFKVCAAISIPKTCYSNEITLKHECSSSDLAESLKFKVQDRTGIPVESILFLCWDNVIPDNVSLYDIGPCPELSITALIDAKE